MKKNKLINGLLVMFCLSAVAVSCGDDESEKATVGFAGIASSYFEGNGDETILIPFVNGSVSESDIEVAGTATEGEDYNILGVTDEGVEIEFLEDNDCESIETIRLTIKNAKSNTNNIHTVSIVSNTNESTAADLAGTWTLTADSWADYALGTELEVVRIDDTHIAVVDYPATASNHADMVITLSSVSDGTAVVETQNSGSYNGTAAQVTTTSGVGSVNGCTGTIDLVLTFVLPCCGTNGNQHFVLERSVD